MSSTTRHSTEAGANTPPVSSSRIDSLIRSHRFGILAALVTLVVVLIYVFVFTPYQDFLFSDMQSFWVRAMDRLNGEVFSDGQFIAWPPIYHILLAEFFRVLRALGLEQFIRLETALTINIVAFACSVYALQRLAVHWFERPVFVLITVLLYGLGFPALYFNAFLLSGNLGAPLFVMAVAVAVCHRGWRSVFIASLLFGACTAIRPSFGPYGLAFVMLYLGRYGVFKLPFIKRAAVFTLVFFAVVMAAGSEVSRISGGRVTGLSANGGLDFFIANTDYHRVDLSYDGWHFFIVVPSLSMQPEQGVFYTSEPFYNQRYYFKLGWESIKRQPKQLLNNFVYVKSLFFAEMLPSRPDAPGFDILIPTWDWLKFGIFMTLGLYAWARRDLGERKPVFDLMATTIVVTLVVAYIFTGEPRYTYSIIAFFYLLFFKLLEVCMREPRHWVRRGAIYAVVLAIATGAVLAVRAGTQRDYPPTVALDVTSPSAPQTSTKLGRIRFPYDDNGLELAADAPPLPETALLHARSRMQILGTKPMPVTLRTYSSWPFALFVDGKSLSQDSAPDFFVDTEGQITLSPGWHDVEFVVQYDEGEGGLALNYSYMDGDWVVRRAVGVDSAQVRFAHLQ